MIPTPLGLVFAIVGIFLLFRPPAAMLAFAIYASLFAGASAIDMPVLGHSSIPPAMLALAFTLLRLSGRDLRRSEALRRAFVANGWLLVFCAYGAASAFILPKIFAERVYVIPMGRAGLGAVPLYPSSQNTTQALYLLGTGAAAVAASTIGARLESLTTCVQAILIATWIHVVTGLIDLVASSAHFTDVFSIVRNAGYMQLAQDQGGYHRIAGMTPEPSAYAGIGTVFLVLNVELWLRGVLAKRTGVAAVAILATLALSTSSTAYLAIATYGLVLSARIVFAPGSIPASKIITLFSCSAFCLAVALVLVLTQPHVAASLIDVLGDMTIRKGQSTSALERGAWARQGFTLMSATRGLGVGVGSFRSSNIFTAILGSIGPAGLVLLIAYCLQVAKLLRPSTYVARVPPPIAAGAAAGWTILISLIPAAAGSPTADPGLLFALFAGLALAWRAGQSAGGAGESRATDERIALLSGGATQGPRGLAWSKI